MQTRPYTDEETVDWMKGLDKRVASAAAALYTKDDYVLVVKAHYKKYWSFPGGVIDPGETPLIAAAREVGEEVGIAIDANALRFRMAVSRISPIALTYQFLFEQEVDRSLFDHIVLQESEIAEYDVVTRQQIMDGDRYYAQTVHRWAEGFTGYAEQQFGAGAQGYI